MVYFIDSCSLMEARKNYPLDLEAFNNIWEKLGEQFKEGNLLSSIEVLEEIKDEDLLTWLKQYKTSFLPLTKEIQEQTKNVLRQDKALISCVTSKKSSSNADPFLIASAIEYSGVIITEEKNTPNHIPYVCKKYGVESIKLTEYLRKILK